MDNALLDNMRDAGVCVAKFRPLKPYAIRRLNNRTHRKLLIADGRVGMIGGVGIAEEWTGDAEDPDHWRDTHVRVTGPVVRHLQGAFAENWLQRARGSPAGGGAPPRGPAGRPAGGWSRSRAAGRCSSCAPEPASGTRTSRRCTSWRSS